MSCGCTAALSVQEMALQVRINVQIYRHENQFSGNAKRLEHASRIGGLQILFISTFYLQDCECVIVAQRTIAKGFSRSSHFKRSGLTCACSWLRRSKQGVALYNGTRMLQRVFGLLLPLKGSASRTLSKNDKTPTDVFNLYLKGTQFEPVTQN